MKRAATAIIGVCIAVIGATHLVQGVPELSVIQIVCGLFLTMSNIPLLEDTNP